MSQSKLIRFRHGTAIPLSELPLLDFTTFRESLLEEVGNHARVASFFGHPNENVLDLYAILSHDWQGELALLHTQVKDSYPSLTPDCPQMHLFERELAEQYGVRPEGHPWLKPVRFHNAWVGCADIWGRDPLQHPVPGDMEFYRVEGEEVHEVGVGPVHAGVIEPGHFRFQCHGEEIMHLEISLGFQHRGIEQMLSGGPHPTTPYQLEAAAGDTTIGHSCAYSQVIESLSGRDASPRAQALRAVGLELERLANHVGDVGAMAGDVGFLPTSSFCGRIRGDYLNLSADLCGSRFGRGFVRPGGVLFDLNLEQVANMLNKLEILEKDSRGAIELCFNNPSVLARFEGVGCVSVDDAETLGLVGVVAKASGLVRDTRLHHPIGAGIKDYAPPVIEVEGDVCARGNVRRREIYASHELLRETLNNLPEGTIYTEPAALAPNSLAISLCEGWRGELVHCAITNDAGKISRYKIVDPSFHNWSALALALRGEQISDFPVCNKSFNLSYCGFDL